MSTNLLTRRVVVHYNMDMTNSTYDPNNQTLHTEQYSYSGSVHGTIVVWYGGFEKEAFTYEGDRIELNQLADFEYKGSYEAITASELADFATSYEAEQA